MTHTYIHPALADNADGEYQVRTGEKKFTIRKTAKPTVDCELLRDQEIPLIYDEDGTLNAEETKEEIFTRVFSASNAEFISCAMSNPSPIKIKESDRLDVFGKVVGKINSNDVPDYRF